MDRQHGSRFDEAWVYLRHSLFRERVRDWLKTLRKLNEAVLSSTQNLSDIFNSPIRDVVLESCPTNVLLPNAEAANPDSRQFYESIGLNEREIYMVQTSIPKRQYYVVSPVGRRLISLGLGGVGLSVVGVNSREERQAVDAATAAMVKPGVWRNIRAECFKSFTATTAAPETPRLPPSDSANALPCAGPRESIAAPPSSSPRGPALRNPGP